jgi:hypothetical protein
MYRAWMPLIAVGLILAGCASTGDNLQRETARFLGENVSPDSVSVSNVDRGATSVRWDAITPNGPYQCSADDMVRRVHCVKH